MIDRWNSNQPGIHSMRLAAVSFVLPFSVILAEPRCVQQLLLLVQAALMNRLQPAAT